MTASERRDALTQYAGGVLTALTLFGMLVAFVSLSTMLAPLSWLMASVWCTAGVLVLGYALRRLWGFTLITLAAQVVFVAVSLTTMFSPAFALFGVIPTPSSLTDFLTTLTVGADLFRTSVAPMAPSVPAGALLTTIVAAIAIGLDVAVMRFRLVVIGVVVLAALALFPSVFVPWAGELVVAVVTIAVCIGLLLAARPSAPRERPRRVAAAVGIAVPAVLVALVITPFVPLPAQQSGSGFGIATTIDATVDLGRDLRNPRKSPVLTFHSSANSAPYLRLATLSTFDGSVWTPDANGAPAPLEWLGEQRPLGADPDPTKDRRGTVQMASVSTSMLPLPAGVTGVEGVGEQWQVMTDNRTVASPEESASGKAYEMTFVDLDATTQQLKAATFSTTTVLPETREVPADVPAIVTDELQRITAEDATTFDKLMSLQTWFRSSEFTYSLDAPVEAGFDGAGTDAMADFLTVKAGYCVHFASTFAVMARELGVPSRVVLGFLPGSLTTEKVDDESVYEVSSDSLHTWPEVYFDDIGWVPFEPTASLGVASSFRTAPTAPDPSAAPSASAAPAPSASASSTADAGRADTGGGTTATARTIDLRIPGAVLLVLAVAAAPAVIRAVQRRRRLARADAGDAVAAWEEALASAVDLGLPFDPTRSPRAIGADLSVHGADLSAIVAAVERQSYARVRQRDRRRSLTTSAQVARAMWASEMPPLRRARAALFPLSLLRRPVVATRPGVASEGEWSRAPAGTR